MYDVAPSTKYTNTIVTKNKFTDKPMALFGVLVLGAYFTMWMYVLSSFPEAKTVGLDFLKMLTTSKGILENFLIPVCSVLFLSMLSIFVLVLIPKQAIHISIIGNTILYGILGAYTKSVPFVLLAMATAVMYLFSFKAIERASYIIRGVAQVLLVNVRAMLLFIICGYSVSYFLGASSMFLFKMNNEVANCNPVPFYVNVVSTFIYVIFLGYAGDVYFARIVFKHMVSRAEGRNISVIASAVKRVVYSFGTIVFATTISFIVLVLRAALDYIKEKHHREKKDGLAFLLISILLFIAAIFLFILDVVVETMNTYALTYNSLFGEGYRKSIKESYNIVTNYRSTYRSSVYFVATVFAFINVIGACLVKSFLNKPLMEYIFPISVGVALLVTVLNSVLSGFLAFEFVMIKDKGLVEAVFPEIITKVLERGYSL